MMLKEVGLRASCDSGQRWGNNMSKSKNNSAG